MYRVGRRLYELSSAVVTDGHPVCRTLIWQPEQMNTVSTLFVKFMNKMYNPVPINVFILFFSFLFFLIFLFFFIAFRERGREREKH